MLGVAALIGRDFDLELLERGRRPARGRAARRARRRGARRAARRRSPSTPGRYSFAHALLRTTLEDELSATRRARLHRRIGEAIEQRPRRPARPVARRARPPLRRRRAARRPTAPSRYAVRAAAQAAARLAYDEAVRLLERRGRRCGARDEPVDQAELARLENALAAAEADAGRWEAARASFARAADAARAAGDAERLRRARRSGTPAARWEQYGVEDAESVALLEEALRLLPDGGLARCARRCSPGSRSTATSSRRSPRPSVRAIADEAVAMARRRRATPQPLAAALTRRPARALAARPRGGPAASSPTS